MPFDVDGARLLYQVILVSRERRSVIFTTNVEFSRWGTVCADDRLAVVIRPHRAQRRLAGDGRDERASDDVGKGAGPEARPPPVPGEMPAVPIRIIQRFSRVQRLTPHKRSSLCDYGYFFHSKC